jgi:hypothetical protein
MPTPCPGSGRRMESTHIRYTRSLWLCSFPSLSSIQIHYIAIVLSCCLPFFHHLLFDLRIKALGPYSCSLFTLYFTFCCILCINLLSLSLYEMAPYVWQMCSCSDDDAADRTLQAQVCCAAEKIETEQTTASKIADSETTKAKRKRGRPRMRNTRPPQPKCIKSEYCIQFSSWFIWFWKWICNN